MIGLRTTVLVAAVLLLGGLVAWEATRRTEQPLAGPAAVAAVQPSASRPAAAPDAAQRGRWVATVLARPLFAATRRPHDTAAPAQAAAAAISLPRMTGTIVVGDSRRVIFAATGDGRPLVLAEGGELNGFRVRSIEPGKVTVVGPGGPRTLRASFDPNPPPAAAVGIPIAPPLAGGVSFPGLPNILPLPGNPPGAQAISGSPNGFAGVPPIPGLPLAR